LSFWQGIRASKLDRVLGGDDEKQFRQISPLAFHAHLVFAHGFEQSRLGARRSAVDFVGQQNVGKDGAFVKMEFLVVLVENRNSENVGRQQVGRKLDSFEPRVDGPGQGLGQRGFASARKIFQQDVAAAGESGQHFTGGFGLSAHHLCDVVGNFAVSFPGRFKLG